MTSLSVGSLLDDNIWHDVVISRNRRDIIFSVDRVMTQGKIRGEFDRLNLNREVNVLNQSSNSCLLQHLQLFQMYVGGVTHIQEGINVYQNYTGCIENLQLNNTNFIRELKEAYHYGEALRFSKIGTQYNCPEPPIIPITFLTRESYAKMRGYEGAKTLNISYWFRTYEDRGLMFHHDFSSRGFIRAFLDEGKVKVEIMTDTDNTAVLIDNYDEQFNDGKWHSFVLTVANNMLVVDVDQRPMTTTRVLKIVTGGLYLVGGGKTKEGFLGCMRQISVDGNFRLPTDWKDEDYCCKGDIVFDACHMTDRCNPNPCKHAGICRQNSLEFICDCSSTGYAGAVCHTCELMKKHNLG